MKIVEVTADLAEEELELVPRNPKELTLRIQKWRL